MAVVDGPEARAGAELRRIGITREIPRVALLNHQGRLAAVQVVDVIDDALRIDPKNGLVGGNATPTVVDPRVLDKGSIGIPMRDSGPAGGNRIIVN